MSTDPDELTPEEIALTSEPAAEAPQVETPEAGAQQPEPDKVETPAEPDKAEPDKQALVPHAALHETREHNKALKAELAELRARFEEFTAPKPEPEAPDEMPDAVLDHEAFKEWMGRQFEKANKPVQEVQEQTRQQFEAQQRQAEESRLIAATSQQEKQFAADNPDYFQAYDHLRAARIAELKAMYPSASEEQIAAQIRADTMAVLQGARSDGRNPAEVFYSVAKLRGYSKPAPASDEPSKAVRVKAAQAASASLGDAPGGAPRALSIADINNMSESELAALSDDDFARATSAA